jgi:hypothetical protein
LVEFRGTNIKEKIICLGTVNLLTEHCGQPIFYMCDGRLKRLAKEIVKVAGFVPRCRGLKEPVAHRGTN